MRKLSIDLKLLNILRPNSSNFGTINEAALISSTFFEVRITEESYRNHVFKLNASFMSCEH